MRPNSPLAEKLVGICLVTAALGFVVFAVFRLEFMERIADGLSNNTFAERTTISDIDLRRAGQFQLRPESNDSSLVRISRLRTGISSMAGTPASFTLTNLGDSNGFPSLRVVLVDRSGRPLRQLVFSEKDYIHPAKFDQFEVELLLDLRRGETGFTAQPFYPEKS